MAKTLSPLLAYCGDMENLINSHPFVLMEDLSKTRYLSIRAFIELFIFVRNVKVSDIL